MSPLASFFSHFLFPELMVSAAWKHLSAGFALAQQFPPSLGATAGLTHSSVALTELLEQQHCCCNKSIMKKKKKVLQIIKTLSECLTLYTFNNFYMETKNISLLFSRALSPISLESAAHCPSSESSWSCCKASSPLPATFLNYIKSI